MPVGVVVPLARHPKRLTPSGRKALLFTLLAAVAPSPLVAQNSGEPVHRLGLSVGFSRYHVRDLVLAPLAYRGTQLATDLSYERVGERSLQAATVEVAFGDVDSSVPLHTQTAIRGQISYGYARRGATVTLGGRSAPVYIGGLLKSLVDLSFPLEYTNGTWTASHSLNLYLGARDMVVRGHSFSWDVHLPLVSYVVRPPWAGWNERLFEEVYSYPSLLAAMGKRGSLAAPTDYLFVFAQVAYTNTLSRRLDLRGRYQFLYHRYDRPRDVRTAAHSFSAGLGLRF